MPKKKNIDIELFKQAYNNTNISVTDIGKQFNCSNGLVYRKAVQLNCHRSRKRQLDIELLKRLYSEEKMSLREIGKQINCASTVIAARLKGFGVMRSVNEAQNLRRAQNWNLRGGKKINTAGYVMVYRPSHPRTNKNTNAVLEHILVWEEYHKKPLPKGYHIRHLNGIKTDNRPSNLVALPPTSHHEKHLSLLAERAKRIRELEIENRQLKRALEDGQMIFSVSEN